MGRNSQTPFAIFEGCKSHDDQQIHCAQQHIETHYEHKITVDQLAQISNLSRRTLQRRFKKATHFTALAYIQKVKVEAAKKLLELNRLTVNQIMYKVGYSDVKYFRNLFRKITGMRPDEYRDKYSKETHFTK